MWNLGSMTVRIKVCNFKKPWNTGSRSHGSFLHLLRFDSCINALLPALSSYVFLYFKQACLLHYIIHMQIKYRCALCPSLRIIGPSKLAIIPAIQVQTLPLEGPRSLGFLIQGPNKECLLNLVGESYLRFSVPTTIWILVPRPSGTKLMLTVRASIDPP